MNVLAGKEVAFLKKFFLSFAALFAVVLAAPLQPLLEFIAGAQSQFLNFFGVAAVSIGANVFAGQMAFEIVNECSSLLMLSLLVALLYANEGRKKINFAHAIAFAFPLLFAFNLLRLALTIAAGAVYGRAVLEAVHFSLWIVDALVVLALWLKLANPLPTRQASL